MVSFNRVERGEHMLEVTKSISKSGTKASVRHGRFFTGLLLVPLLVIALSHSAAATDYSAWTQSRTITVKPGAEVAGAVTKFPLLIHIASNDAIWSQCKSNGFDIRFTSADGLTDYPFQRAYWNYSATTGLAEFWVLVPTIAAGPATTSLKMYWGNAAATDVSNGSAVFATSNNFRAVWHMNAPADSNELDATGSGHDAVQNASPTVVDGPFSNKAKSFDGSTQFYRVNNSKNVGSTLTFPVGGPFTISTWVNSITLQTGKAILGKVFVNNVRTWTGSYTLAFDGSTAGLVKGNDINGTASERSTYQMTENTWTHITWVRISTGTELVNTNLYINGVASGSAASAGTTNDRVDTMTFCIGKDSDMDTGTATFWNGSIGETQVSNVVRDSNWAMLSYQTQGPDYATHVLVTPSAIKVKPAQSHTSDLTIKNGSVEYTLQSAGATELSVSNAQGRVVLTMNRTQAAGHYSIALNKQNLPAGGYIVRLKAAGIEKRAMMVVTR